MNEMSRDEKSRTGFFLRLEVKIRQVHAEEIFFCRQETQIRSIGTGGGLDDFFQHFHWLRTRLQPSRLVEIDEEKCC